MTLKASALKNLSESEWTVDKAKQYLKLGKFDVVEELLSQAINQRKEALEAKDPGVADLLDLLGEVKAQLGKYEEAHECFNTALKIYEQAFYAGHYKLGPVYNHQATCYIQEGKFEAALEVCLKAQDIFGKTLSGEHRLALEAVYKLATIHRQLGKPDEALKVIAKAKKNVESPLGPFEEFAFLEALLQDDEKKPELAEKAYREAIAGFKQRRSFKRLGQCMQRYSEFLKGQNKNSESSDMQRQADHYKLIGESQSRSDDIFAATLLRA
ncbi:MAG: tetratricopeptide repeat protein [Candidatus Melainabacteria bacterium]|nr:tetratricopeptide repeat protein [Candidatus Melainabacteria bacterium]